ncbi:MAG: hypothetical protein MI757_15425 [Pirellulales bacterium]|nr:hypothetical protein [Pirellulales bacterium]
MAEMTIQLRTDPETGKKDIVVSLRSDEDAMPHEHEQQHKALVDSLIEGGVLEASEVGQVIVERVEEESQSAPPVSAPQQEERQSQAEGN